MIESNPPVNKASHAFTLVIDRLNDLTEWRFVDWGWVILSMVNNLRKQKFLQYGTTISLFLVQLKLILKNSQIKEIQTRLFRMPISKNLH